MNQSENRSSISKSESEYAYFNNKGISLIETIIGLGLLGVALMFLSSQFVNVDKAKNLAISRAVSIQLESQIQQLLASPVDCKANIINANSSNSTSTIVDFNPNTFYNLVQPDPTSGPIQVITSGQNYKGYNYYLTIEKKQLIQTIQKGTEHPVDTDYYIAELKLKKYLVTNNNSLAGSTANSTNSFINPNNSKSTVLLSTVSIPIALELEGGGSGSGKTKLNRCTTRAENVEDTLYNPTNSGKSIRDCFLLGGIPFPAKISLVGGGIGSKIICRTPIVEKNSVEFADGRLKAKNPSLSCPTGWTAALGPSNNLITSTIPRDISKEPPKCKRNEPYQCSTTYHSFSDVVVDSEICYITAKGGSAGSASNFPVAGATAAGLATGTYAMNVAALPAALNGTALGTFLTDFGASLAANPVGWAVIGFVAVIVIFSSTKKKKCGSDDYLAQRSQPVSIGCY